MNFLEFLAIILFLMVILFFVLLVLMLINILQNRKIYAFRADEKLWAGWGSQVFGTLIFVFGFLGFIFGFLLYEALSHPEFIGLGLSNIIVIIQTIIRDPLKAFPMLIYALIGFGIAIFGMGLSIIGIKRFIKNIEKTKKIQISEG